MVRRSPLLLSALALVLCGAGTWLFLSDPQAPVDAVQRGAEVAVEQGGVSGELDALPSDEGPIRSRTVTAPAAPALRSPGAQLAPSALVNVRFLRADTAEPVTGFLFGLRRSDLARVELGIPEGPRVGPWTPESYGIVDGDGRCTFRIPAGAQVNGTMRGRPGHPNPFEELMPSSVQVDPLAAGDNQEVLVRLHPKRRTTAHFRFVDAVSGAAIPDARIHPVADRWIQPGLHDPERGLWSPLTKQVALASAAGHLSIDAVDLESPAEVFAEGYGPAWLRFRDGGSEAEPRAIPMHAPGRIDGRLEGLPAGAEPVEIQLRATHTDLGFNLVRGADDRSTWHLRLAVGPGGTFSAGEVPSSGAVTLEVCSGDEVIHSTRLKVPPGGVRDFSWAWTDRVALEGLLLDRGGQAVGDAQVWIHPTKATLAYTTFKNVRKPLQWANTAADGTFQFEGLEPGPYAVGPARGPGPGYAMVVSIPHTGPLTVQPPDPSTVQGQVLLDGVGVPGVALRTSEGYYTTTLEGGRFELECLGVSAVYVSVNRAWRRGEDQFTGRSSVKAAPGATGVILELVPEVRRGAVAVDAQSGEPVRAEFTIVLLHPGGTTGVRKQLREQQALRSLRVPDAPTIIWATTGDDRVGRSELLDAVGTSAQTDARIPVAPGGRVRVSAGSRRRVDVSDGSGRIHAIWVGPRWEELVLPAGTYRLAADGVTREVKVEVAGVTEVPKF